MVYTQYYEEKLDGKIDEVLGDRGVVILDGRNNIETMIIDSLKFNGNRRPAYKCFRIFKGETFTKSIAITEMINC